MAKQTVLFDPRFLDRHAGAIISDPLVALVELVANAWDAYATKVDITWPDPMAGVCFSIRDNGSGMTPEEFERRWVTVDYDRVQEQGVEVEPPPELKGQQPRHAYGRNGRGRYAAFRFSSPYQLRTWRDGIEVTYRVSRGSVAPLTPTLIGRRNKGVKGHGTEICALALDPVVLTAEHAREALGTRFLTDPGFTVTIDGTAVGFDDIPENMLQRAEVDVPHFGAAEVLMIDSSRSDRTTKQHGIAWRVRGRLVGECSWRGFHDERILDGRTAAAKRFTFIVFADFLADAVAPDWSEFRNDADAWQATCAVVQGHIRDRISEVIASRRGEVKQSVKERLGGVVQELTPLSRARWTAFVDQVVDSCPSITEAQVEQVASILANLEQANSKYGLITKLHELKPGELDDLHRLLDDWTLTAAKAALDELQSRLRLIEELNMKLRDENADEVQDLQPLFEDSLWVFGPEFESIEYTSNRGMTEIIRKIFGKNDTGSRNRPDFVIVPDGSIGLYSRDAYGEDREVNGVASLVIAEIKRPGITIGSDQKNQAWKYVKELMERGLVDRHTQVSCFVLGSRRDPHEGVRKEEDGRVIIEPMSYDVFIRRAEKRMLGLRDKLKEAPFLQRQGFNTADFVSPPDLLKQDLFSAVAESAAAGERRL
jgi:hypothetical protein